MLMAELTAAVQPRLHVRVLIPDNHALAQVVFEQKEAGYRILGTELSAIDIVVFARASGAQGDACRRPEAVPGAIARALAAPGPATIHGVVDPAEPTPVADEPHG